MRPEDRHLRLVQPGEVVVANPPLGSLACQCTWTYHRGLPCDGFAWDPGSSPRLCMSCLFSCQSEREEV